MMALLAKDTSTPPVHPDGMNDAFVRELDALFRQRRDVRRFLNKPVDENTVTEILATSCTAPSVGLSEPTRFLRLQNTSIRSDILANFEAANAEALQGYEGDQAKLYAGLKLAGLKEAPVQFAVFCDTSTAKGSGLGSRTMPEALVYSSVCAVMTMWLAASARGLGLGWVSIFDVDALAKTLKAPESWSFIGCLCIGWPEEYHLDPELERAGWEHRDPKGPHVETR
ncbi:MAG: 5,6-dimethylbenzimidazole synthase [Pseudomonadota bacterium]